MNSQTRTLIRILVERQTRNVYLKNLQKQSFSWKIYNSGKNSSTKKLMAPAHLSHHQVFPEHFLYWVSYFPVITSEAKKLEPKCHIALEATSYSEISIRILKELSKFPGGLQYHKNYSTSSSVSFLVSGSIRP